MFDLFGFLCCGWLLDMDFFDVGGGEGGDVVVEFLMVHGFRIGFFIDGGGVV